MTVTFTATRAIDQGTLSVKGTKEDKLSGSHPLNFDVEVTSDDPDFDPITITEADVFLQWFGSWPNGKLPVVNRSIYRIGRFFVPYFVCRSKTVKRNPKRRNRFRVECSFEFDGERGEQPQDEETEFTDISPKVESTIEEVPIVIFKDYTPAPDGPRDIITPNGNLWSEPTVRRFPVLTLRITQYESTITYEQMLERSLRCNQNEYRTKPRYQWMTDVVVATETEVVTPIGPRTAAQVIYTVRLSPFAWGWKDSKLLVDTHYRESPGSPPVPFIDSKVKARMTGFIKEDGTIKNGLVPDYTEFEPQPTINFGSFLRA